MRIILALLLMLEGFSSGIRLARFLPVLVIYGPTTIGMLFARAALGVCLFASGWMLLQRRAFGTTLGAIALLASALFATLEIGFRLAPTSLLPSYRWPVVGAYWAYAIVGVWVLRRPS